MAVFLFATVTVLAACGDDPVSTSSVDKALLLMTGTAQPGCVKDMDYRDGDATFRCGHYDCWTTAHAHNDGFDQRIIEGADYYDCDNRYADPTWEGTDWDWERCVVDTHQRMSVLPGGECKMHGWMPGLWG